jgi:hypothetical protein
MGVRPGTTGGEEDRMRKFAQDESWVIYQLVTNGVAGGPNGVCRQAEWEEMERLRPGAQSLVQCGLPTEGVADRLARGTSGDPVPKAKKHWAR